jgi:hypothetical protein
MAKQTTLLPKMEVLIIIIFFIGFVIWAFDKCGDTKRAYSEQARAGSDTLDELMNKSDSIAGLELPAPDSTVRPANTSAPATVRRPPAEKETVLYITIDGMNLRDEPTLQGKVLTRLDLYEEVTFLNEVTDSTQQINLGSVTADEPWVKVRGRGHEGWVYGAGVEYYKRKLEGMN